MKVLRLIFSIASLTALYGRLCPTANGQANWIGPANGDWNDDSNWDTPY